MCLQLLTFLSSFSQSLLSVKKAVREAATIRPAPCKLTFDLLTLKVVSVSRVTWATSVPILVFLGPSVLDLGPTYATDRRQTSDSYGRYGRPLSTYSRRLQRVVILLQRGVDIVQLQRVVGTINNVNK